MSEKVLVVDDEKAIVKGIKFSLEQDGMEVDCAYDGNEALAAAHEKEYDIVLLDLMLPGIDGMEVCKSIREFSQMPIIMLTAKGDDTDKIMGLENGADDYITKPFNILEVKARMKAILRRNGEKTVSRRKFLEAGDIKIDKASKDVFIKSRKINLTTKEYELLLLMVSNPNTVYGRDELLKIVWGFDYPGDARTVDVHVRRLREKIEPNSSEPLYVQTKWGSGYYFNLED